MSPKVFVSYSHDSDAHKARVDHFVARLRGQGITVVYDRDIAKTGGPDEGWPRWCERQIIESDYVLACCTAMFHERFEGEQQENTGRGVAWEALSVRQYLYQNPNKNRKVRALVFGEEDRAHIPNILQSFSVFLVTPDEICAELFGWLNATGPGAGSSPEVSIYWPPPADDFDRLLADRSEEFDWFKSMLSGHGLYRVLLVQGPSNSGKTVLIQECIRYAAHTKVPCSQVDFNGGLPLDNVFGSLVNDLGAAILPRTCGCEGSTRTHEVIADLQQLRTPLFLSFDTYQDAPERCQNWLETQLLTRIGRCPAVVVVIAGQSIPEHSGRSWAPLAHAAALPPIQSVEEWLDYVRRKHGPTGVKREHIQALTVCTHGDPGQVSAWIGALVQGLPAG